MENSYIAPMMMKKKFLYICVATLLSLGVVWFAVGEQGVSGMKSAIAAETEGGDGKPAKAWYVRCQEDPQYCEIFQALVIKESGARFSEIAVGFPPNEKNARGVIILPLEILLEEGVRMTIDDSKPYKFNFRYCGQEGCVAIVTLNDKIINQLKRGNQAVLQFKNRKGQNINLPISLNGFTSAIGEID
mgnify:CR=1 FL=1